MNKELAEPGAIKSAFTTICPKNHGAIKLDKGVTLAKGRVHEVQGDSAEMFALIVAATLTGPLFWIGQGHDIGSLTPTGMQSFVDPARLVLITGITRQEILWAGEQALRAEGVRCVVIELQQGPDLKESRRLQIACEESGAVGIILIKGRAHTSAADTRWQCHAARDHDMAWQWRCVKNKKGKTGTWAVTWRGGLDGPNTVHMATATAA